MARKSSPPPPGYENLRTTQTGILGERAVASLTLLLSRHRVRLSRPYVDDHSTDYLADRPPIPVAVSLQPKAATRLSKFGAFQFTFNLNQVPDDPSAFLGVCVRPGPWRGGLAPDCWVIPGVELKRGFTGKGRRTIDIHPSHRRPLRWHEFRHPIAEIGAVIGAALDDLSERQR